MNTRTWLKSLFVDVKPKWAEPIMQKHADLLRIGTYDERWEIHTQELSGDKEELFRKYIGSWSSNEQSNDVFRESGHVLWVRARILVLLLMPDKAYWPFCWNGGDLDGNVPGVHAIMTSTPWTLIDEQLTQLALDLVLTGYRDMTFDSNSMVVSEANFKHYSAILADFLSIASEDTQDAIYMALNVHNTYVFGLLLTAPGINEFWRREADSTVRARIDRVMDESYPASTQISHVRRYIDSLMAVAGVFETEFPYSPSLLAKQTEAILKYAAQLDDDSLLRRANIVAEYCATVLSTS